MVFKQIRKVAKALDDANISTDASVSSEPETGTPEGRYPIGDGWYRTPEVIDPRDPINYPDSPFNGGNPIDSSPIGLDIGVSIHPCGFDVDVQTTLGFIMGPIGGVSYRHPGECRKEPPKPTPGSMSEIENVPMNWDDYGAEDSDIVICALGIDKYSSGQEQKHYSGQIITGFCASSASWTYSGLVADFAKLYGKKNYGSSFAEEEVIISATVQYQSMYKMDKNWRSFYWFGDTPLTKQESDSGLVSIEKSDIYDDDCRVNINLSSGENGYPIVFIGTFRNLKSMVPGRSRRRVRKNVGREPYYLESEYINTALQHIDIFVNLTNHPYRKNPPPPFLDKKDCCMECCQQTNQQQEDYSDLLKRILKIVTNVENRLGCKDYPFNVPASLISESEGFISSLLPKPTKKIDNTQQFMRWIFESFEEVIGQWELPIEIKDADPTTPGEQAQGMKILNISEGFGELAAIGANASINTEVIINICTRLLYELAAARQTTADTNSKAQALIEYFGFKTKESRDHMEMTFTAGKDRLDETLKESKQPVALTLFDDPKKTYKHDMAALLHAATIIKTVFTKKASGADLAGTKAAIADMIRQTKKNQTKLDGALEKKLESDFDAFCESFERGWTDELPADPNVPNVPWGEPYANRPKVVKVVKKPTT